MFFKRKAKRDSGGARDSGTAGGAGFESEGSELPEAADIPAAGRRAGVDSPSTQFLTGDSTVDRRTVQVLLEAISRVANTPVSTPKDLEALLVEIVDLSVEVTEAERGLLILPDPREDAEHGGFEVHVARSVDGDVPTEDLRFSTSVARRVLERREPVRATVQSDSEALELGQSVFDLKLRAVMCVPLLPAGGDHEESSVGGVLYVDSRAAARQFGQRDLSLFAALASQISATMQKARLHLDRIERVRLEQSLELASSIQRDLMPQVPHTLPGFEVHGWYRPAEQTAGDFYDFVPAKDNQLAVVVGDVTGHGVGPALITASAQAGLRSYLRMLTEPGEIVTLLNQDLSERMDDGRFLTLFLGLLSPDGTFRSLNAGHPSALLYRASEQECTALPDHGPALGMISDEVYESDHSVVLQPGDAILAFSDGLAESRDSSGQGQMLGEDSIRELFREAMRSGKAARESALELAEHAMSLSGGVNEDDITLVVVRRVE